MHRTLFRIDQFHRSTGAHSLPRLLLSGMSGGAVQTAPVACIDAAPTMVASDNGGGSSIDQM